MDYLDVPSRRAGQRVDVVRIRGDDVLAIAGEEDQRTAYHIPAPGGREPLASRPSQGVVERTNVDAVEGLRPDEGLELIGVSRPIDQVWKDGVFESQATVGEILVFCMSRRDTPRIRVAFHAVAGVKILGLKNS